VQILPVATGFCVQWPDAQSLPLLHDAASDFRQVPPLHPPLAQPAFVVQVEPSAPLQTLPTQVAPAVAQSLEVRQVPPLAFLAQTLLVQVPVVQSEALLQAPPAEEMTQTPPVHAFVKQSLAIEQVPPACAFWHLPLVQTLVTQFALAVQFLPAEQRVHGAEPQPLASLGTQTGWTTEVCAEAGAMTDCTTGAAQTVAAPTNPARLRRSRRDSPDRSCAPASSRATSRRAADFAQSSNLFTRPQPQNLVSAHRSPGVITPT
jgi:hypothetical protein